jgi:molybdopterin-containing oxidoreductase family membrane subunit
MKTQTEQHDVDEIIFQPIEKTQPVFYIICGILVCILAISAYMYIKQLLLGLGVTGLNRPVYWGFYIINFVFFIGISHAGTLISAILRLCQAEWRRPITRMAEVITAIVLCIGGIHPILDLGRPDRMLNLFQYGRLQSPLLWDVISVTAYFTASTIYLYLPMIPDIAILRDRGTRPRWLYAFLAWGWQGTPRQQKALNKAINLLMILVIPIAVSVHTIIAYIFAMTIRTGWHSTIFGPYFVVGAIFSGIAAIFIIMIVFRKIFHFENYLKPIHFQQLSKLLLLMSIVWFYFTFSEMLTGYFGNEPHELNILWKKLTGEYSFWFWLMFTGNFILPVIILSIPKLRTIGGIFIASCCVIVGMWLERFLIVIPTLSNSIFEQGIYLPSLVEVMLFAGGIAAFLLGYFLFAKFFPLISVWEIREGREEAINFVSEKVADYQPFDEATNLE